MDTGDPSFGLATQQGSLNKNMTSLMRRISDPFVRSEQTVQAAFATLRLAKKKQYQSKLKQQSGATEGTTFGAEMGIVEMVPMGKSSNIENGNGQGREMGSVKMVAREKGNLKNSCMELANGQGRKMGSVEMVAMGKGNVKNMEMDNFGPGSVEMTEFSTINDPLRLRGGGCDSDSDDIIIEDIYESDDSVIIISDICSVQERESNNNYESEETKERKCDFCQKDIKSLIPHLKKNDRCRDFHFETYLTQHKSKSSVENLKELGLIINNIRKLEAQKRKRKNADYVKDLNKKRRTKRQARNTDAGKCCKDYFNTVKEIMSKTCDSCSCFFSPQKLEKVETSHPCEHPDASLYLCSLCRRLNDELKSIRKFEQEESKYSTEYENWADTHFSLERRINELQKVFNEKNLKVSMKIYNDQEGRHTVLFPSNLNLLEIAEKDDGLEDSEPTVLLPQDCFDEPQLKNKSKDEAELAAQSCDKSFLTQLSVVIEDKLATMEQNKRWRENLNLEKKFGKVNDGSILLKEINSLDGCLSSVKGTKDYLANLKEDMDARQKQNGFRNIQIMWPVFAGFEQIMTDPFLALCLLRMNGHAITCVETESDGIVQSYRMTCGEDCLPFDCEHTDKHQTPLEKLKSMEYDINPFTVSRFIIEKIEAFVDKLIRPIADNFSLFLSFDRPSGAGGDSGFVLVGNIWLEEISESDEEDHPIPEVLLSENVKKLLGEGYGRIGITNELSNWTPNCYSQEPDITERTQKIIDVDNCRETSIFEAILTSSRKIKLQWSSQTVKHIDTEDPRKDWMQFRKAKTDEEGFYDYKTKQYWVEAGSPLKDYRGRPGAMEPLILSQLGLHFNELEQSNPNFKIKLDELKRNGGVEVETENLVLLITNREKYPLAPKYLPRYMLLENKILVLKSQKCVLKFKNEGLALTDLILYEPWRFPNDFDFLEADADVIRKARSRRKEVHPHSS